jgi:hypothetical protein
MSLTTDRPVWVDPDARIRAAELGLQSELAEVIEHTRQSVPNLHSLEVLLYRDPDDPTEPRIRIIAHVDQPGTEDDPVARAWGAWFVNAFSPDVCRWFGFDALYQD